MAAPAEAAGNSNGHGNQPSHRSTPAGSPALASLTHRAPVGPIPTRNWTVYLSYKWLSFEYENFLEQKNQCIRSRLVQLSHSGQAGLDLRTRESVLSAGVVMRARAEYAFIRTSFPYPSFFPRSRPREDNVERPINQPRIQRDESIWGLRTRWFGIERVSVIESETQTQPVYVVLGIFARGQVNPRERVVFIHRPKYLFLGLRWGAFRLRGLRNTVFSLRHVQGFKLYRCDAKEGTHERIDLDSNGLADLQVMLDKYKDWHVPNHITQAWANWIHQTLNNGSHDVLEGTYGLELVIDWSATRISIVVVLPVLLSLAIGLWLNASAWTDLATIQTAWGTASYIVTAGGLLAALLGILSSIADQ